MTRDMDLIRDLLMRIEKAPTKPKSLELVDPKDEAEATRVLEHLKLLEEAGFIKGQPMSMHGYHLLFDIELTWSGHDFVDAVRDPELWQKTKKSAEGVKGFTVDLLKDLAKGLIKKQIEARTGVKL